MTIQTFTSYLEKLDTTASRNDMTVILAELLEKLSPDEVDKSCYLLLGRLTPKFGGIEFQMATKSMLKVMSLAYEEESKDVTKLFKEKGDLGLVAETLANDARSKKHDERKLKTQNVSTIYETLLRIAQEEGSGSVERKIQGFSELLKDLDPLSAKYIVRIPVGMLRLGFSDMTLLDALSWMAAGDKSLRKVLENAYNVSADIGLIAKAFKEKGEKGIVHLRATPGIPIRPQQAERLGTAEEMIAKLGTSVVEWKLDGFRAQIHIIRRDSKYDERSTKLKQNKTQITIDDTTSKHVVQIFSRSLENTTHMFPEIVAEFQNLHVESAILDGEAIGYDPKTGKHLPFQETIQRKRKHGIDDIAKKIPLRYYAFDVLSLNGESFLDTPFNQRRKKLYDLFEKEGKKLNPKTVTIAEQVMVSTPEGLRKQFDESVRQGFEGIMVKKTDAVYTAGARNFNWVKFKHVGVGKLADTLDCLVMGYYAGQGKRSSFGIGAFLVGVRDTNSTYLTVCKIGTGLSDEQWKQLRVTSYKLRVKDKPEEYAVPKELFPDVWVKPQIVVEIAADEITKTPLHTAKLALRFPRLISFRTDKSPREVTTVKEVEKLFQMQNGGK
ncbi:ATP-dependent DNA ligase [Candidatus Roizmanbacteria bacterium]|nr:ATP-dependent DNA ligase [Candidatus Roizmanbacteria bacterium]